MAEDRMLSDEILLGLIKKKGGGGGGTTDYDDLNNKPQIGGVTLSGNKSASDLGLASTADLTGKQDILTFDDTPTDNSNNPVKSNGIYDALALKQNATDNSLDTDAKTIVGAINELEGDVSSLKSGLTGLITRTISEITTDQYKHVSVGSVNTVLQVYFYNQSGYNTNYTVYTYRDNVIAELPEASTTYTMCKFVYNS